MIFGLCSPQFGSQVPPAPALGVIILDIEYLHASSTLLTQKSHLIYIMAGQPTPQNVPPPEIRPYDQGLLTIGFP